LKTLDKDKRDGLIAALKADISGHPDKKKCLTDLKEKIVPVLADFYGKEETDPILEELERHIILEELKRHTEELKRHTKRIEETEKKMPITKIEVGDIYLATQDFKNIGAVIDKNRLIVIEKYENESEMRVGVYLNQENIDSKSLSQRWTLEVAAIEMYCVPYRLVKESVKPAAKETPVRRMSQKQFAVALSEH
jgi:hypothetical protein